MSAEELVSIEDMTNWLQSHRISSTTEDNLHEEIIVTIIKRLKKFDKLKKENEKLSNIIMEMHEVRHKIDWLLQRVSK